ncbi:lipocalin-like domain-containing protein [Polyangium sorediatum]|uniref:Lipocalin-like domain-containing protein n=1 Tax=Polyangium sorediatum TaxID=889274 RepID=A0ABT6P4W9_9BACT|nr:lipocalin-like domain-containing protein [Polyangium sorediatum]MDI1435670.1 lipocalin-like domain-containing protein [Polyangium sorediatum]
MKNLIGTWHLVSFEVRRIDGSIDSPMGPHPRGLLIYTADGHMAAQLSHADRDPFSSGDIWSATPEAFQAAYTSYVAYYGRYEVDEEGGVVRHLVEGSLFPNWCGGAQARQVALDGDHLVLSSPFIRHSHPQGLSVLRWRRA